MLQSEEKQLKAKRTTAKQTNKTKKFNRQTSLQTKCEVAHKCMNDGNETVDCQTQPTHNDVTPHAISCH